MKRGQSFISWSGCFIYNFHLNTPTSLDLKNTSTTDYLPGPHLLERKPLYTQLFCNRKSIWIFFFHFLFVRRENHKFSLNFDRRAIGSQNRNLSAAHRRLHHCQTTSSRNRQKNEKGKKSHWTYSRQKITSPSKCICEKQISHIWMKFLWRSCVFVVDIFTNSTVTVFIDSQVFLMHFILEGGELISFVLIAVSAIRQCFPSIIHQGSMNHWASWDLFLLLNASVCIWVHKHGRWAEMFPFTLVWVYGTKCSARFLFYISTRNKIGCCDVGDLGGLPIKTPLSLMPTLTEGDVTINWGLAESIFTI